MKVEITFIYFINVFTGYFVVHLKDDSSKADMVFVNIHDCTLDNQNHQKYFNHKTTRLESPEKLKS